MYRLVFMLFLFVSCSLHCVAQDCEDEELQLIIHLHTDQYGHETTYQLTDGQGVVLLLGDDFEDNTDYRDTLCISPSSCLSFTVFDEFNDGFTSLGYIDIFLQNDQIAHISEFESSTSVTFNCTIGQSCDQALQVSLGTYPYDDMSGQWFRFSPSSNGIYEVSTCDQVECDTKLWIYDDCVDLILEDEQEGTIFYADNGDCGEQAVISAIFQKNNYYIIRVNSQDIECAGDSISISFVSPITGCTDSTSCNYNMLATVDDGSCISIDSMDCPKPDLVMDVGALKSSMTIKQETNNDECLINEGCMRGYGVRDVINFRTVIANIGDADFFIGAKDENSGQFEYDNCHNHYHYAGYAEYVLYDEYGQYIPIGFKNGFCVEDLNCPSQDMYKYGCDYMGISAGCADIYSEQVTCQWVDVTDVPDGNYTFVTRVNWNNAPDALGKYERDTLNNWAQVCISLSRDSGDLVMEQIDDCAPYIDCAGNLYGKSNLDCNGDCDGTALRGDLDGDITLSSTDINMYIDFVLEGVSVTDCNDLNADGELSVYDAALLTDCLLFGSQHEHVDGSSAHDHCSFPAGIYNGLSHVDVSISDIHQEDQWFTIAVSNNASDIVAYQLGIEGVDIVDIENIAMGYQPEIQAISSSKSDLIIMSSSNSHIPKSNVAQDVLKVYYDNIVEDNACIKVVDIVNAKYEQVNIPAEPICVEIVNVNNIDVLKDSNVKVIPNPFSTKTVIELPEKANYSLTIYNTSGIKVRSAAYNTDRISVNKDNLQSGVYLLYISSDDHTYRTKIVVL